MNSTSLALKSFASRDRLIFIPINLVLGKDKVGMLAGSGGVVLDSPIETVSLGVKAHQGMEGRT